MSKMVVEVTVYLPHDWDEMSPYYARLKSSIKERLYLEFGKEQMEIKRVAVRRAYYSPEDQIIVMLRETPPPSNSQQLLRLSHPLFMAIHGVFGTPLPPITLFSPITEKGKG